MTKSSISFGFGERLRAARKAAGLTGAELGEGAGESGRDASKASVSDWENERHYPKADQLRVICLKLNISADKLVFGDIREELKLIQAEATIEMLSPEQRRALLAKMMGEAAPDHVVEQKMPVTARAPAPSHEQVRSDGLQRVNPRHSPNRPVHTVTDKHKYDTRAWVIKEKDEASGQSDSPSPSQPERKRSKGTK